MTTFINHDNKIIFVHTPKTGGTSITDCMVGLDQSQAAAKLFGIPVANVDFWEGDAHATTSQIRSVCPDYDTYLSFTVMREPFSWLMSLFRYRYHSDALSNVIPTPYSSFDLFIKEFYNINENLQSHWFTIDGKIDVNEVLDFDDLQSEMTKHFTLKRPLRKINVSKKMECGYTTKARIDNATKLLEPDLELYEKLFGKRWEL